ncbi:flagellar type III secretion system pore protein FliP [Sphingomonas sp. So64.6b]|uniref:flagellar type III secretion system pore protein FliP n=1 Tax=Sphingomonas sp. So64.6b TaxID=2997354 RepID=UPI0015FEE517|nr:flagellar type III secretion system pore protein FliP [Sphingomonas sp. So64.6b]QNA82939.1 flagellar type III secretion system pore protein FliP [Sphingomonas sp. So64.6b]
MRLRTIACVALSGGMLVVSTPAWAAASGGGLSSDVVRTALILTLLAVVPSILICMTSFVRIIIVLSMVRHAFGMPETPPNPVLISLALFLTAFTMSPTLTALNTSAIQPLLANRIGVEEAIAKGSAPLRDFMLAQTRDADIEAIYSIANATPPERPEQVDILKLAPAFMLNELRVSFTIGFVILLPFLLIDLVVSAILLALGMMMVPPATISLPIKLLMFVLIDGWSLILQGVLGSFR